MKKINLSILLFVVVTTLFFGNRSYAQLAGTFTIDPTQPPSPSNFSSFTDFSAALDAIGIGGPVIIEVNGTATFNEVVNFNAITGTSATNTIRINGNGANVEFSAVNTTNRSMLKLNGTNYLTIDNINFKSLKNNYGWGAQITGGSSYDSVINCTFDLSINTQTSNSNNNGIIFTSGTGSPSTSGTNGNNCYIGNNHIIGPAGTGGFYYGIYLAGANDNNIIENNIIENGAYYGISITATTGTKIINNKIHRTNKTGSASYVGVYTIGNTYDLQVIGNKMYKPGGPSNSTGTFHGIYATGKGTALQPVLIANNAIYNVNLSGSLIGIFLNAVSYTHLYHNTIVMDVALNILSETSGINAAGNNSNLWIKNNLVSITAATKGNKFGFNYPTTASMSMDSAQKNNYYVKSTQTGTQYYGRYFTKYFATDSALHASYPNSEVASPVVNPNFVNATAGDLTVQNDTLIGAGIDLTAYVPKDINGNPRSSTPTIGAFETLVDVLDAATDIILSATPITCEGSRMMSAVIRNNGNVDITSLTINWNINGGVATQINYTQTLVPAGSPSGQTSDTVELGNVIFDIGVPITVKAWTSDPNGGTDDDTSNDDFEETYTPTDPLPSADGIIIDGSANPSYTLKIDNPQNVDSIFWDYGDGTVDSFATNYDISKLYPNAGPYTITVILRNECGDVTLTSASFISLPVEMDRLQGTIDKENHANLSWNTLMETNNTGFYIYRSDNGKDFKQIDFVKTLAENGNSNQKLAYNFRDEKSLTSQTLYKIAQTDLDGKIAYSNIVALQPNAATSLTMIAHPNPINDQVQILFQGEQGANASLILTDISGRILKNIKVQQAKITMDMKDFTSGMYLLKYTDDQNNIQMKLIKK